VKLLVPLGVFSGLALFLALGLQRDPHEVPSPLIDKPAPHFRLRQLDDPARTFSTSDMRGRVWMLNVWASWCVSCRAEHAVLAAVARRGVVPVYGLDYKDERDAALSFLGVFGNPYTLTVQDADGRVGINYGVYGVPETYLIDKQGVIRFKHIGALTLDVVERTIVPMVRRLEG